MGFMIEVEKDAPVVGETRTKVPTTRVAETMQKIMVDEDAIKLGFSPTIAKSRVRPGEFVSSDGEVNQPRVINAVIELLHSNQIWRSTTMFFISTSNTVEVSQK